MKVGVEPNFFQSAEYLTLKDLEWNQVAEYRGFVEPGEDGWFVCPLDTNDTPDLSVPCWASQPDKGWGDGELTKFLDYQIIYDPKQFLFMVGNKWLTFRRNVHKWCSRTTGNIWYRRLDERECSKGAANLLDKWAKGRELEDVEVMLRFAIRGLLRWGLFLNGELVGLNVCDENWMYINHRLCVDRGDPFLQEYLRYLFYTSEWVQNRKKLVNDGGSLGSEGLLKFKKKLNPIKVAKVYSNG
jgi:hypothetical protein